MKRFLMAFAVALVWWTFLPFPGRAAAPPQSVIDTAPKTPPRSVIDAAPPVRCGCPSGGCKCAQGECGGADCPSAFFRPAQGADLPYDAGYRRAVAENKPLLVWQGLKAVPAYARAWGDGWVQCVAGASEVPDHPYCLVVAVPDGKGGLNEVGALPEFYPEPKASEVRQLLAGSEHKPAPVTYAPPQQFFTLAFAPALTMSPPMFGGGFRGGFGGGACRGGG